MAFKRWAVAALYTGLGLTIVAAVVPFATTELLADHIRAGYPAYDSASVDKAVDTYLVLLAVIGGLGAIAWLGTAWAVATEKRWARPTATTILVAGLGVALTALLITDTSGDTGLPAALGWLGMVPCLAGIVAVALLWRRPALSTR